MCKKLFVLLGLLSSCAAIKNTPKADLIEGFYNQKTEKGSQQIYINIQEDSLHIYKASKNIVDTTQRISYPSEVSKIQEQKTSFRKNSFDVDFLTIPLKYRSGRLDVPAQLNAFLNGAVYLGYRMDKYIIHYEKTPLYNYKRNISHYGFSLGIFTGVGSVFMSPTNTSNILTQEYDGVVWNKGIGAIIAIDKFTLGLVFGFDNLLDKNKSIWIYEGKSWFGLAFGLNLN